MAIPTNRAEVDKACMRCRIPTHMWDAVFEYLIHRRERGGFFMAVMQNDFMAAAARADHMNGPALLAWANLLYNHFPPQAYGSPENVSRWLGKEDSDAKA